MTDFLMAPSSQGLEPPGNPGRFSSVGGAVEGLTGALGKPAEFINWVTGGLILNENTQNSSVPVPSGLPMNIHDGQQGKHIPGHNNFDPDRSPIAPGVNPQHLLDGVHSGQYPIIRLNPRNQSVVDFGQTIGSHDGRPTQYGIIYYGNKGAHIVPANPIQR